MHIQIQAQESLVDAAPGRSDGSSVRPNLGCSSCWLHSLLDLAVMEAPSLPEWMPRQPSVAHIQVMPLGMIPGYFVSLQVHIVVYVWVILPLGI